MWESLQPRAQTIASSRKFQYAAAWTPVGVALWLARPDSGGTRNTTDTDVLLDAIFIVSYTFACLVFVLSYDDALTSTPQAPRRHDGYELVDTIRL